MKSRRLNGEALALQQALSAQPPADFYVLRLFVTGTTPRSGRAIQNIRAICEEILPGRYELEVVDIYQHPEHAKPEQVLAAPTLVRKSPLPVRKLIGDLSDKTRVLLGLEILPRQFSQTAKERS